MKFILNLLAFLSSLLILENYNLALTDYKIRQICYKKKIKVKCIKNLKEKRLNLFSGNRIEIPVIPFKSNKNLRP